MWNHYINYNLPKMRSFKIQLHSLTLSVFLTFSAGVINAQFGTCIEMYTPSITYIYCEMCNGTIEILHEMEANEAYEYSVDNGHTWQLSNFFDGLCKGDYLIIVRNLNTACAGITTAQLPFGSDPYIENIKMECSEWSNVAQVNLQMVYGVYPFTVEYIDPQFESHVINDLDYQVNINISNATQGDYQFRISDKFGCSRDTVISFTESCFIASPIQTYEPEIKHTYCEECNGEITLLHAEESSLQYEYSIDNGQSFQLSNTFTGLCPGDYQPLVRVIAYPNSTVYYSAQVNEGEALSLANYTFNCNPNLNSAAVTMQIFGGTNQYHLSYIDPLGETFSVGNGTGYFEFTMPYLKEGEYQFFIADQLGCLLQTSILVEDDCYELPPSPGNELPDWVIIIDQLQEGEVALRLESSEDQQEEINLAIFSSTGEQFYTQKVSSYQNWRNTIPLPSGLYFIIAKSNTGEEQILKKFIF